MHIEKITAVYFSPTDSTKNIISLVAGNLPLPVEKIDITAYSKENKSKNFLSDELVIFAVPVYGGRVPTPAVETIKKMNGNKTPAIIVAAYGNREYDDALIELYDTIHENGFITAAAAAFVTEHSIMHSVAKGRPDAEDNKKIIDFAIKAWNKIEGTEADNLKEPDIKGNRPYRKYDGVPFKPQTDKSCNKCGECAKNCPVNAISESEPQKTNKDLCISCMRCIKLCPLGARKLNGVMLAVAEKAFSKQCRDRKEPEIFI